MLQGVKTEFKVVNNPHQYIDSGSNIASNEYYSCVLDGDTYFVCFTGCSNQILIINPCIAENSDPDGGSEFMNKNVLKLIDSLVSQTPYID